ncbi:Transmembrane protein 62 [Cichlidogyrus casuarinus]|uniref:Transmembrane protein 62 n=1 Tax=Cichlidogyrus casuarinus TaxID=1844966 RepID=A0ABD2QMS0_9PLAT
MDATPIPGLKAPYNFFGILTSKIVNTLLIFEEKIKKSNHTFWFSHYPTSTVITNSFNLRELVGRSGFFYLCGHLHTMAGMCDKMYTLQPQGYFELELADWKFNRGLRIVAVDHDLVSFQDFHLMPQKLDDSWPLGIITNPKNARFLLPSKEPTHTIANSTHIRILAWSNSKIRKVTVFLNDNFLGLANKKSKSLYVLAWEPKALDSKLEHTIKVLIEDEAGKSRELSQIISVDGLPRWSLDFLSTFILATNFHEAFRTLLLIVWVFEFMLLLIPRYLVKSVDISWSMISSKTCLVRGIWRLSTCDVLFYSKLIELCFEICGPIFFAKLIDNNTAIIFPFGALVNRRFHQLGITIVDQISYSLLYKWPMHFVALYLLGKQVTPHAQVTFKSETSEIDPYSSSDSGNEEAIIDATARETPPVYIAHYFGGIYVLLDLYYYWLLLLVLISKNIYNALLPHNNRQAIMTAPEKTYFKSSAKPRKIHSIPVSAFGGLWHPQCFVCVKCNTCLVGCDYQDYEKKPYCVDCYTRFLSPICAACNSVILDKCAVALGKPWHPEHLCCVRCGALITENVSLVSVEDNPYCQPCYMEEFAVRCAGCKKVIDGECITAMSKNWHPGCFVCTQCSIRLRGRSFYEYMGSPLCEMDYAKTTSRICSHCDQPITDRCVNAMKKRFHENCFKCTYCNKPLKTGIFKEHTGNQYCHQCYSRLFN